MANFTHPGSFIWNKEEVKIRILLKPQAKKCFLSRGNGCKNSFYFCQ